MMRSADRTTALSLGDTPVQLRAHTTSGQHSFNAVVLLYILIKGVGIQPFADGVFSRVSGLITILDILFAVIMQLGLS